VNHIGEFWKLVDERLLSLEEDDIRAYGGTWISGLEGCNHSWKLYQGFTDIFEYCEHCDTRR
jgi:hypothetical protein